MSTLLYQVRLEARAEEPSLGKDPSAGIIIRVIR